MLEARLGASRVLARAGSTRLHLLNVTAAWLWEARLAGLDEAEIADALAQRFGLPLEDAQADVRDIQGRWRRAGLLGAGSVAPVRPAAPVAGQALPREPVPVLDRKAPSEALRRWRLRIADQAVALAVADDDLAQRLAPVLAHLAAPAAASPGAVGAESLVDLAGGADHWRLGIDGVESARGAGADAAATQTLAELVEVGCQGPARLLVVHGAGIAHADRATLLIGRGGAGKTTLAAALNAIGHPLLGDDVVPITPDGQALGIGLGPCLKAGSWPVLADHLPGLDSVPVWQRLGEPVRFAPPPGPIARGPLPVGALLFPAYVPGHPAALEPLAPEDVLQRLIAAEPYLPPLTQARLEALVAWVAVAPAFALRYPDLSQGLAQVAAALGRCP